VDRIPAERWRFWIAFLKTGRSHMFAYFEKKYFFPALWSSFTRTQWVGPSRAWNQAREACVLNRVSVGFYRIRVEIYRIGAGFYRLLPRIAASYRITFFLGAGAPIHDIGAGCANCCEFIKDCMLMRITLKRHECRAPVLPFGRLAIFDQTGWPGLDWIPTLTLAAPSF
jgi:hypothetical protein